MSDWKPPAADPQNPFAEDFSPNPDQNSKIYNRTMGIGRLVREKSDDSDSDVDITTDTLLKKKGRQVNLYGHKRV